MEKIEESFDVTVSGEKKAGILENDLDSVGDVDGSRSNALDCESNVIRGNDGHELDHEQCLESELNDMDDDLQNRGTLRSSELRDLLEKRDLYRAAVEMSSSGQHPIEFYVKQLSDEVEARRKNLAEMEAQWDAQRKDLEEKKMRLEEALCARQPEVYAKLKKLEEIDRETDSIISEIKTREEEISELSAELEKQPNLAPRKTYIQRIIEITKNSRKQDADIDKILKDTRELQLESNSIQERLHRTHVVVDETIFREAKKDPVVRQAYRILTSIHDSFEQIAERLLDTDRARRDRADFETKLASMNSRNLDIEKLRADLDALKKENDLLEQQISSNSSKDLP